MAQNIEVKFKVSGNELQAYMDTVKKKGEELAQTAIKSAIQQTNAAKEQLKAIEQVLQTRQRLSTIEVESSRSIAASKRDDALKKTESFYANERDNVLKDFVQGKISTGAKDQALSDMLRDQVLDKRAINTDYREQMKLLREQEKQSKLQVLTAKEQVQTIKESSKEQVKSIKEGDKSLTEVMRELDRNDTVEERLKKNIIEDSFNDKGKERGGGFGKQSIIGSILTVDSFSRMASASSHMVQTQNGFDAIESTANTAGRIAGAAIGAVVGSLFGGVGAVAGAAAGSTVFGEIFSGAGAVKQKQALLTQELFKSRNRYSAITGTDSDQDAIMKDMSSVGVDAVSFMQLKSEYARRRASGITSDKTTKDAIFAEKGFGVDQGTSALLIEMQRSSRENNRDLAALIGGVWEKGAGKIFKDGDRTFLNEFLGKFTTLQKELLKTQGEVATGTTMDILTRFDSIGGQFSAKDPRSMGLLQQLNNSLMNPDTDFKKSLTYYTLKKSMPKAGIADIIQEQQKGIGSSKLMQGMFELYGKTGNEDSKRLAFASLFGDNVDSGTKVLRAWQSGRLRNGETFGKELKALGFETTMQKKGEAQTAPIERLTAENTNKVLAGEPVDAAIKSIKEALETAFSGSVIVVNAKDGTLTLKGSTSVIKENAAKKAEYDRSQERERISNSRNGIIVNH